MKLPESSFGCEKLGILLGKAKTLQGILGQSRIQTTLDLYTDEDLDETIAAEEKFIDAVGFDQETVP